MLVTDNDEPALKSWLEKRLAKISDAEAPILAEYCIALLKHDQSEEQVRDLCVDQLSDFLRGDTKAFVNDVFTTIKNRTFTKDGTLKVKQPQAQVPIPQPAVAVPKPVAQSTKPAVQYPPMPMPPPEMLNDPAFMMHMQQAAQQAQSGRRKRKHCFAFEQRGFCNKGAACPYEHIAPAQIERTNPHEYDPNFSAMSGGNARGQPFVRKTYQDQVANGQANGGPESTNGSSNQRFSEPEFAESVLAVKNIPPEAMNETVIRQYFQVFGPLAYVRVNHNNKSANIKFIDPQNAQAAYASPAPIFNNRFVKLFWLKGGHKATAKSSATKFNDDAMEVDTATIETKQREHDDRLLKKREFDERAAQLAAQKAELQRRQEESQALLRQMQSTSASASPVPQSMAPTNGSSDPSRAALEAQLAQLQAKATALGLTPEDLSAPSYYAGRGRGRGRGRGAPRGRGAASLAGVPYARRTLDLRPRTLRIETPNAAELESDIRARTEYELITRHENALQVTFKTRRDAEVFSARKIGDMSWVKEPIATTNHASTVTDDTMESHNRYDD